MSTESRIYSYWGHGKLTAESTLVEETFQLSYFHRLERSLFKVDCCEELFGSPGHCLENSESVPLHKTAWVHKLKENSFYFSPAIFFAFLREEMAIWGSLCV